LSTEVIYILQGNILRMGEKIAVKPMAFDHLDDARFYKAQLETAIEKYFEPQTMKHLNIYVKERSEVDLK
jgi:hypothetical protein